MDIKGKQINKKNVASDKVTKKQAEDLKKSLFAEYKNIWETTKKQDLESAFAFADDYMTLLDMGKTERECVILATESLEEIGFKDISTTDKLNPGMKV